MLICINFLFVKCRIYDARKTTKASGERKLWYRLHILLGISKKKTLDTMSMQRKSVT